MLLLSNSMPRVESGLDVLVRRRPALLRRQRIALLAHQASIDAGYTHATTLLRGLRGAKLVALLAPEHGLWGAPQDHARIAGARDPATGLPVWSLYGTRLEPTAPMLRGVDTVVIDLQDVGSRYYTFVWTMTLAMRVCARMGVRVVVLDRPNPLGGTRIEGNVADPTFASFVGLHPLAIRHGMTIGELAVYLNEQHAIGCHLTVVPMRGWRARCSGGHRASVGGALAQHADAGHRARLLGGCLIEGTNLSEGRGTTRPFEWIGAPYLDAQQYAAALERERLPGVRFRPARFLPTFQKWPGGSVRASRFT